MFKRVLVPVKATRGSEKAIDVVCEIFLSNTAGSIY
jgi:hypothetical protein